MKDATFSSARLLALYERISDAEDAIPRLRRLVLDLAVRGKLVEQDAHDKPEDFTPSDKSGKTLGSRASSKKVPPSVEPYSLPKMWKWVEIGDQLDLLNGMAFKPSDWASDGLRIVRIQNLNRQGAPFNYCDPNFARERSLIDDGSFLISWSGTPGTSFGAFIWDRGPAVLNQHIFRCDFKTEAFTPKYLRLAINGRLDEMIEKAHGGVGLQHITKGKLEAMLIGLPPLAEQHRIVAKVDELMALCDQLEQARAGREAVRDRLTTSSLARLTGPDTDAETFQSHARFALQSLPTFTTRPDQIKTLRQTILNLAVRGKLVAQDAADEPAAELLKRFKAGKDALKKETGDTRIKLAPDANRGSYPLESDLELSERCHELASMRVTRLMWAMRSQASALAMVFSQSFAIRRHLPSHAKVRSTTHRRGMTSKPFAVSERLTICNVQRPIFSSAPLSLGPA